MSAPWSVRWVASAPMPPLLAGALLSAGLLVVVFAVELATGDLAVALRGEALRWKVEEYLFSTVLALVVGYVPAAHAYLLAGLGSTFDALRQQLRGTDAELDAARQELLHFEPSALRRIGVLGIGLSLLAPVVIDLSLRGYTLGPINWTALGHRLMAPAVGWLLARQLYTMISGSRRLARLTRERARVDLLERQAFAPLARHGLRNALLVMGVLSIFALLTAAWGARPGLIWVLMGGLALAVSVGAAGLLLPVRGARDAIRQAKASELAWCNHAIRERRAALGAGPAAPGAPPLDELIAYRGLIESVREWPFDLPTLTRFGLYLAIPLGSWLGGALFERLLDALLD